MEKFITFSQLNVSRTEDFVSKQRNALQKESRAISAMVHGFYSFRNHFRISFWMLWNFMNQNVIPEEIERALCHSLYWIVAAAVAFYLRSMK